MTATRLQIEQLRRRALQGDPTARSEFQRQFGSALQRVVRRELRCSTGGLSKKKLLARELGRAKEPAVPALPTVEPSAVQRLVTRITEFLCPTKLGSAAGLTRRWAAETFCRSDTAVA